jgi:hypothetical protein
LQHSRCPKQTFVKYASLIYEPGATKLLFFFNSGTKEELSLSLDVKCDQQTHKKNDVSNYGINLKEIVQQSSITILPMFLAGEFPDKIEAFFFAGFQGFFMGSDYGKTKCYGFMLWT